MVVAAINHAAFSVLCKIIVRVAGIVFRPGRAREAHVVEGIVVCGTIATRRVFSTRVALIRRDAVLAVVIAMPGGARGAQVGRDVLGR